GRVLKTIRIGTNGTQITQGTFAYDSLGNRTAATNALGAGTTYTEVITNYLRTRTTTYPDGGTRIDEYYRDGQLRRTTGSAVRPVRYEYGKDKDGTVCRLYTTEIKLDSTGSDTAEWVKTYRDMVGRNYKTVYADNASQVSYFNTKGQLTNQVDADGVSTLFAYNLQGEQTTVARDADRDALIDTNGLDRIQLTLDSYVTNGSVVVKRRALYAWATNNVAISNMMAFSDSTPDGLLTWNTGQGLTNRTAIKYAGAGNRYVTNTAPDGQYTISHFLHGLLQSITRKDSGGGQLSQVYQYYDA